VKEVLTSEPQVQAERKCEEQSIEKAMREVRGCWLEWVGPTVFVQFHSLNKQSKSDIRGKGNTPL